MRLSRYVIISLIILSGCKHPAKQSEDKIYSRHLQRHVSLTVITTPMPDEKSDLNLVLYLNGQDLDRIGAKKIIDSLYSAKAIRPLIIVGIHGMPEEYGLSSLTPKAEKFNSFIRNELYPFIKKKVTVRKFREIAVWGAYQQGIGALDIAWENADKIGKLGIFEGAFGYTGINDSTGSVLGNIRLSRKRPALQYWLFASISDTATLQSTKRLASIIEKKNISRQGDITLTVEGNIVNPDQSMHRQFASFLLWAFRK
jgi:enterochelin esterase-like enzyme